MKFRKPTKRPSDSGKRRLEVWEKEMKSLGEKGFAKKNRKGRFVLTAKGRKRRYQLALNRIAWPIVDAFCPGLNQKRKKKIITQALDRVGELWLPTRYAAGVAFWPLKKILVPRFENSYERIAPSMLGHELIHALHRRIKNSNMVVSAYSAYIKYRAMFKEKPWERGTSIARKNIELRKQYEAKNMHALESDLDQIQRLVADKSLVARYNRMEAEKNTAITTLSMAVGKKATIIERSLGKKGSGAGLFFIRLVFEGVPWREAEERIMQGKLPELEKWQEKYGKKWEKVEDISPLDMLIKQGFKIKRK